MIRVKICGVTHWPDARAACDAGANLVGLNFYEKSPRRVSAADAAQIRGKLPAGVEAVGVVVNSSPEEIASVRALVDFHAVQLHGDESPGVVSQLASTVPVIKAFRVDAGFVISALEAYPDVFAFLLDAARAGQYGGTGLTTDWRLTRRAAASHRIILAGGLRPENVAAAILLARPYAVDVASGVESKPGKKDPRKLREFIREVRRAESQLEALAEESERA